MTAPAVTTVQYRYEKEALFFVAVVIAVCCCFFSFFFFFYLSQAMVKLKISSPEVGGFVCGVVSQAFHNR